MLFLLQSATTITETAARPTKSLLDLIISGGWTMIPIGILLVMAIFILIERYLTIRRANKDPEEFFGELREKVRSGDIEGAKSVCKSINTPASRMILKGLSRLNSSMSDIRESIENVGKVEIFRLEKRLPILATIAGAAPMLGFLGTVTGLISAFNEIVFREGNAKPVDLADGIAEAMITTVAGLIVGILAYLAYNILTSAVNSVVYKLELTSMNFIDLLQEPA